MADFKLTTLEEMETATNRLLETGAKVGADGWQMRVKNQTPHCKFGEQGICCRICTMGPCRITPKAPRGVCGCDAHGIVGRNFLRFTAGGAATHSDHGRAICETLRCAAPDGAYKVKDPEKLFKVIDSCQGKVELVTGEGDRLNLKSKLSQFLSLANIFSVKEQIPELCIRTSCIVGFPGETEKDFQNLLDFIEKVKLDRVGCFKYSNVDGVKAGELPNQISEEVKEERYSRFMEIQQKISLENMKKKIGTVQDAIVDDIDYEEQVIITRSRFDSPEIDGQIYIPYDKDQSSRLPEIGSIIRTEIYDANEYDLFGEL